MQVKDVMNKSPKVVKSSASVWEAAKIMADQNIGFLPVEENDQIIGALTDRDITIRLVAANKDLKQTKVQNIMTNKKFYCYDTDTLENVLKSFGELHIHRMPVMNSSKRLVGEISMGDIAGAAKKDPKLYELIGKAKEEISKAA